MIVNATVGHLVESVQGHAFCCCASVTFSVLHDDVEQESEIRSLRELHGGRKPTKRRFVPVEEIN